MIVAKCPLRVSLVGGSTDLEEFIDSYGRGSVISFSCNLYTYIILFTDKNGFNHSSNKYVISYSKREEEENISQIKNDVAREGLKHFNCEPINVNFTSDIFSHGSGLASSSSYVISLIKAISEKKNLNLSDFRICNEALEVERKFNPLTGRQDSYGCGMGGLKRMEFYSDKRNEIKVLDDSILQEYDMHLIHTGVNRSSTKILKSLNLKKAQKLLPMVDEVENLINKNDHEGFFKIINEGWAAKKETSEEIINNKNLKNLDDVLTGMEEIKCHKLCGAGGGGYFLVFSEKGASLSGKIREFNENSFKITLSREGVHSFNI